MHTFADLCAALFEPGPDEPDIVARFGTTIAEVHTFYARLADHGLVILEDRITGTWCRTTRAAPTLSKFLEQVEGAGIDVSLPLAST